MRLRFIQAVAACEKTRLFIPFTLARAETGNVWPRPDPRA